MASHHNHVPSPTNELDSVSVASTPRSDAPHDDGPRVRFMCSFGGKIVPRPHDNQLRYVGGDTRIVAVHRHATFSSLLLKLSKLTGTTNISVKYQLPNEDLDALITVTGDDDVENMMEEYDRLSHAQKSARLRVFLFPTEISVSRSSSISSLLDGSAKRESWFVDALNGGPASGPILDRGRSEVSSIVSEVPDYLFGLDNSEDAKIRNRIVAPNDSVSVSDPGSPAPVASSPFCSTSSSLAPQSIPDLPLVRTRPVTPVQAPEQRESDMVNVSQPTGYSGGPMWHYPNPAVQVQPMYYMPGGHVQPGNAAVQPVQMRAPMIPQYPVVTNQVPIGFPGIGQVYGGGMRPYEMSSRILTDNSGQPVYYGARNMVVVPGSYPGQGVEEMQGPGPDMMPGRVSQ